MLKNGLYDISNNRNETTERVDKCETVLGHVVNQVTICPGAVHPFERAIQHDLTIRIQQVAGQSTRQTAATKSYSPTWKGSRSIWLGSGRQLPGWRQRLFERNTSQLHGDPPTPSDIGTVSPLLLISTAHIRENSPSLPWQNWPGVRESTVQGGVGRVP